MLVRAMELQAMELQAMEVQAMAVLAMIANLGDMTSWRRRKSERRLETMETTWKQRAHDWKHRKQRGNNGHTTGNIGNNVETTGTRLETTGNNWKQRKQLETRLETTETTETTGNMTRNILSKMCENEFQQSLLLSSR